MNATEELYSMSQRIWLNNATRRFLTGSAQEHSMRGPYSDRATSNQSVLDHAIQDAWFYDAVICGKSGASHAGVKLLFELALEDLT